MGTATWLISDTHFGHEKTCTVFKRNDGSPLRPFANADEMNEYMIKAWNDRVRPNDKIYCLGDVVINRRYLSVLDRLNGDKVLIKGNHDIFKLEDYAKYFRDIRSYHVIRGMILCHVPVHPNQLERFGVNVHGHLHYNRVMKPIGFDVVKNTIKYSSTEIDSRYFNVSVECIDFAPILLDEVIQKIKDQGGTVDLKDRASVAM